MTFLTTANQLFALENWLTIIDHTNEICLLFLFCFVCLFVFELFFLGFCVFCVCEANSKLDYRFLFQLKTRILRSSGNAKVCFILIKGSYDQSLYKWQFYFHIKIC